MALTRWRVAWRAAPMLLAAGLLAACGSFEADNDVDFAENPTFRGDPAQRGFTANFDLTRGLLPSATNLFLSGSLDGTLNIPSAATDSAGTAALKATLNALDGFSLIAPLSTTFALEIDPATLTAATVRVFEVSLTGIGGAVTRVERELAFGNQFLPALSSVDASKRTLAILWRQPLKPRTSYVVALTNGIKSSASTGARPAMPSDHYLTTKTTPHSLVGTPAAALEPVRLLVRAQEAALAAFGVDPEPVVLSWTFTTQSVGEVLAKVRDQAASATTIAGAIATAVGTTATFVPGSPNAATVYVGTLTAPYYLDATNPLGGIWQPGSAAAGPHVTALNVGLVGVKKSADQTMPLLLTVPRTAKPAGGWPVVIFQHGITSNRTAALAIADAFAGAGFATVAIDMPLHGLAPGHPLRVLPGVAERTFDLDRVNNATGAPGPDGTADSSGTHFINLASLLTSRDNLRQATADLFALRGALASLDYDGGGADFDTTKVRFAGHSLGAMVGTPFLALQPAASVGAGVLGMPGGGIAKLLDGSGSFGPRVAAGLAANGVNKGTADYESFMAVAQAAMDSADPLLYAEAAATGRGLLLFRVKGDATVPNNVLAIPGTVPSFLAGTDPLMARLGLLPVTATTPERAVPWLATLKFAAGTHSSLLSPAGATPTEFLPQLMAMQAAAATFVAKNGGQVVVTDAALVEP